MNTISDIIYNTALYSQAERWVLILYQMHPGRTALTIPLDNIDLLSFMTPFDDILGCQDHIKRNHQKKCALFTYSENIETWLWNNNAIPANLEELIIFCPFPEEKEYLRGWTRRYTQKVKNIVTYDALEREALLFGMNYIQELYSHFINNPNVLTLLQGTYKNMCLALSTCFQRAANRQQ